MPRIVKNQMPVIGFTTKYCGYKRLKCDLLLSQLYHQKRLTLFDVLQALLYFIVCQYINTNDCIYIFSKLNKFTTDCIFIQFLFAVTYFNYIC